MGVLEYVSETELEWTIDWVYYKFGIDDTEIIGVTHKSDWSDLFSDWTRYASIEELIYLSNNNSDLLKYKFNRIVLIDKYGNSELLYVDSNINDTVRIVNTIVEDDWVDTVGIVDTIVEDEWIDIKDNSLQEKMHAVYIPDDEIVNTDIVESTVLNEEDFSDRISFVKEKIKETDTLLLEAKFSYENERLYQRERDELQEKMRSLNYMLERLKKELQEYEASIQYNEDVKKAVETLSSELSSAFSWFYEEDYENDFFWYVIDMEQLYVGSDSTTWYRDYRTSVNEYYHIWEMAIDSLKTLVNISENEEDSWEDYIAWTLIFDIVESNINMFFKNKNNGDTSKSITVKYHWHDWNADEEFDWWQLIILD